MRFAFIDREKATMSLPHLCRLEQISDSIKSHSALENTRLLDINHLIQFETEKQKLKARFKANSVAQDCASNGRRRTSKARIRSKVEPCWTAGQDCRSIW